MTKKEVKRQIIKSLDNVPEMVLIDILELLKAAENLTTERLMRVKKLKESLLEDKKLLDKLLK